MSSTLYVDDLEQFQSGQHVELDGRHGRVLSREPEAAEQRDDNSDGCRVTIEFDNGRREHYTLRTQNARFDADVLLEVHRLRVRDEARRRYDRERLPDADPFDAGTLTELARRPPEPAARVAGLIPWQGSTLLAAQRKAGKTTLMANLCRCLITGEKFLGNFDVRPLDGTIVVLNYELSAAMISRWFGELITRETDQDRVAIVNLRGRRNPLTHPDDREQLAKLCRDRGAEALMVDPFGRAFTGTSQNDPGEVGAWLADLERFARAEAGATDVLLTAHAGWDAERTRGSSALEDWPDAILTMVRDHDTDRRYLRAIGRDVELDESELEIAGRRLLLSGNGSRKEAREQAKWLEQERAVIDTLTGREQVSVSKIEQLIRAAGTIGVQRGDVGRACQRLAAKGLISCTAGSHGAKLWTRVSSQ